MKSPVFSANFTDVYGVQHTAAQCMISSISFSSNAYFDHSGETNNQSASCSYQVLYWHSQEAKNAGARPQEFMNVNLDSNIYMNAESNANLEETIAKCQAHFLKEEINKSKQAEV